MLVSPRGRRPTKGGRTHRVARVHGEFANRLRHCRRSKERSMRLAEKAQVRCVSGRPARRPGANRIRLRGSGPVSPPLRRRRRTDAVSYGRRTILAGLVGLATSPALGKPGSFSGVWIISSSGQASFRYSKGEVRDADSAEVKVSGRGYYDDNYGGHGGGYGGLY
ncbi:uncharacterized protein EV422DRAFT_1900 [Fimicolochytrium jonesii]|uniref:uncharacterized protein n=1 Tax=Fimicolochytrium jonesii TaxID=1396493 RepID=UPI0022FDFF53|nr:uncharacterized protein EV422DRAFT_1900 [Fimicolochytrium jonesii]KAI8826568.1 hypothetical protein EV422DRAFT_1900 [Fimicolochytrium jonesii]